MGRKDKKMIWHKWQKWQKSEKFMPLMPFMPVQIITIFSTYDIGILWSRTGCERFRQVDGVKYSSYGRFRDDREMVAKTKWS